MFDSHTTTGPIFLMPQKGKPEDLAGHVLAYSLEALNLLVPIVIGIVTFLSRKK